MYFLEAEHLFQSVGCGRNEQSVSHSSTESEVISLDAGLRMDGLPALDLWKHCDRGATYNQGQLSTWSHSRNIGQIQPNRTSSGKLEYVQPNWVNEYNRKKS